MKVALLNEKYHPYISGGAERSLKILAEALRTSGAEPEIVTVSPDPVNHVAEVEGIRVHYLAGRNLFCPFDGHKRSCWKLWAYHVRDAFNGSMAREVRHALERIGPDVVHTNNLSGLGILSWKVAKAMDLPIVHTLRDHFLMCVYSARYRRGRTCTSTCPDCIAFARRNRRLSRMVDVVVGNSRDILEPHLDAGYFRGTKATRVIYNASATGVADAANDTEPMVRNETTFAFLGRITREKGIELLLEATEALPGLGWRLVVAGEGNGAYVEELKRRYRSPNISWLGWVEPAEVYREADWVVVPSLWREPLPRVVLEAHGWGVPVVASKRGGIPEVVEHRTTGLLFDPDSPNALSELLFQIYLKEWRATDFRSACLSAGKRYHPSKLASEYLDVYAGALARVA